MTVRILAIAFIFCCTTVAWFVLGGTIVARTSALDSRLKPRVASLWGEPLQQSSPRMTVKNPAVEKAEAVVLTPLSSRAEASIDLEHRQKGLLWYSTYRVAFHGTYEFENTSPAPVHATLEFPLPSSKAVYDDLVLLIDGKPVDYQNRSNALISERDIAPGARVRLQAGYRSQGLDRWRYAFGNEVSPARDFRLLVRTNFRDIDFEDNTLAPGSKKMTGNGWELEWNFRNLLSGAPISITMPEKLQPGPLAGEISFFAPVSLFFFFFVLLLITTLRSVDLHPMNYFFLAAAFFAFHLLFGYLVDHIDIHAAFLAASAVSIFLVVSYLRLVTGIRFAAVEAGLAQLVYLVLFSYAFFFKGYTGLSITIGAILTLFVAMQMTGRIRWSERFRAQNR